MLTTILYVDKLAQNVCDMVIYYSYTKYEETKGQVWSGFKLFDTLLIVQKDFSNLQMTKSMQK